MTSTYDSRGRRVGATVVEIQPNLVTQAKTQDGKDGYDAIQLGYGSKKSVRKPQLGHTKKAGFDQAVRWFREVRINEQNSPAGSTTSTSLSTGTLTTGSLGTLKPGTEIKLNQVFSIGDAVKVQGVSKGKGFQGGVRRHGFAGGPKTHGQSDRHRAPGAVGSGTTPGRVYKGKKMAGHMGSEKVSIKNLEIVGIDKVKNYLIVKGGIPGPINSLLVITKLGRIKGYTPPPEEKLEEGEEEAEKSEKAAEQNAGESEEQNQDNPQEQKQELKEEVKENAS